MPVSSCASYDAFLTSVFTAAGSGIKVSFAWKYKWLFLRFSLREEDLDDGQGESILRIDFSNNYKFAGVWNVCG